MSSLPTTTKSWLLRRSPVGNVDVSQDFILKSDQPLPALEDNQILVKTLYLSNDPAQRGWISDRDPSRSYTEPIKPGSPMTSIGIGQVISSRSRDHPEGAIVRCLPGWSQYAVIDCGYAIAAQVVTPIPGLSITQFLGALGFTSLTALYGLETVRCGTDSKLSSNDEIVVVSGAAGATGSMAVQIAKRMLGCKTVIGIAGTDAKCSWVTNTLGADLCLNYKDAGFKDRLREVTGRKATVYFDNVGGPILDLMLENMAMFGRVLACGSIANYNAKDSDEVFGLKSWGQITAMRLEVRGIIVTDAADGFGGMVERLVKAYQEGKIVIEDSLETVVESKIEGVPEVWLSLFDGGNNGKLVTKIVD
jgi:NADPH-dependent curcumin reductase CurA